MEELNPLEEDRVWKRLLKLELEDKMTIRSLKKEMMRIRNEEDSMQQRIEDLEKKLAEAVVGEEKVKSVRKLEEELARVKERNRVCEPCFRGERQKLQNAKLDWDVERRNLLV